MVKPVFPQSKEKLKEEYDLSSRGAVRIAALWTKGIGCSEGLLEEFEDAEPLTEFLFSDPLMDLEETLTEQELEKLLATRSRWKNELTMMNVGTHEDRNVLCLEEEKLADNVFEEPEERPDHSDRTEQEQALDKAPMSLVMGDEEEEEETTAPLMEEVEKGNLVDQDELKELQMTILTGVDPDEKVEALRQISISSLPDRKKSAFLLKALSDESLRVRTEAVRVMDALGVSPELRGALETFLEGDSSQKSYALDKIQSLKESIEPFEQGMVLALLLTELDEETNPEVMSEILGTFHRYADIVAERQDSFLTRLTRTILQTLVSHFDDVAPDVKLFYQRLGTLIPEQVSSLLWNEVEKVEKRTLNAYLLILLGNLELSRKRREDVSTEMVQLLGTWSDTDVACRRLGNNFIQQGETALTVSIDSFFDINPEQREFLLRLMSEIMLESTLSESTRSSFGNFLVQLSEIDERNIRETLLEQKFLFQDWISPEQKRKIVENLLDTMSRFRGERIEDLTELALKQLGRDIAPSLIDYVLKPNYEFQQRIGIKVLGDLFYDAGEEEIPENQKSELRSTFREFITFLEDGDLEENVKELRTETLCRSLSGPFAKEEQVRSKMNEMRERVEENEDSFESLQGLAWLVSSRKLDAESAENVGKQFLGYLYSELPGAISREKEAEKQPGRQLLVGRKTEAYTTIIPTVIDGLTRIGLRRKLEDSFRKRICDALLEKWDEVINFETVWGPASVTKLAENLGKIAQSPYVKTDQKEEIIRALTRKIKNLTIVNILGDVLGAGFESSGIRRICTKVTRALLEMREKDDYQDSEDQRQILKALGKICSRRNISGNRKKNRRLRNQLIDALFQGLQEHVDGMIPLLKDLRDEERLPEKYRKKINEKLERFLIDHPSRASV